MYLGHSIIIYLQVYEPVMIYGTGADLSLGRLLQDFAKHWQNYQ
jgi:hypothetical protein